MAKLKLDVIEKKQDGENTFVSLRLSEDDGDQSTSLELTFHDVKEKDIDVKDYGMFVVTKDGAPVSMNFGKPESANI